MGDTAINHLAGEVIDISYQGSMSAYCIGLAQGAVLRVSLANASREATEGLSPGQRVTAAFAPADCVVLER